MIDNAQWKGFVWNIPICIYARIEKLCLLGSIEILYIFTLHVYKYLYMYIYIYIAIYTYRYVYIDGKYGSD